MKERVVADAPAPAGLATVPFEYVFPAIRGIQAKRNFFVSMCPLRLIPKIFLFDEEELVPELRAQRVLNKGRLPEIARYIVTNPDSYVFSALTASIDGEVRFDPLGSDTHGDRVGVLHIPMSARFIINDGQHRRAAIEMALRQRPEIGDESIAVVFFVDTGLERSQQMFADLNRYAIRPSKSIGVLYDHRDDRSLVSRLVVMHSRFFRDVVEMERSTLSPRSRKLFTLSAIYGATSALLDQVPTQDTEARVALALAFWEEVASHLSEWRAVVDRKISAGEVRRDFIHSHGIVLQAIGRAGNTLLREDHNPSKWKKPLQGLATVDWSRANSKLWEGRAMIGGRLSKTENSVTLTTNAIKKHLGLKLTTEERRIEAALQRGA